MTGVSGELGIDQAFFMVLSRFIDGISSFKEGYMGTAERSMLARFEPIKRDFTGTDISGHLPLPRTYKLLDNIMAREKVKNRTVILKKYTLSILWLPGTDGPALSLFRHY
jgi:hypothetical protein